METPRRPWMKFYPADWRAEPRLRMCSLAARGLWIDIMAIMHEANPYGHLFVGDKLPSIPEIAGLVGRPLKEVSAAFDELRNSGVCSIGERGEVYSRRMVRDRVKEEREREIGRRGGNPILMQKHKAGNNPGVNPHDIATVNGGDIAHMPDARDQKNPPNGGLGAEAPRQRRSRKPETLLPEGFVMPDEWIAWAVSKGLSYPEAEAEADKFINSARAKGRTYADWPAAWRYWIGNRGAFNGQQKPARRDVVAEGLALADRALGLD